MARGAETMLCSHLPAQGKGVSQQDTLNVDLWKEGLKILSKS